MPVAKQSIIAPEPVESRLPLKKTTVGWIAAFIFVLTIIGVFAPRMMSAVSVKDEPVPADVPPVTGRPSDIDSEFDQAARRQQPPALPDTPAPSAPLPMVGESLDVPPAPVDSHEAEIDAAGRTSKSLAYDASTVDDSKPAGNALEQQLRSLMPQPAAGAAATAGAPDRTEFLKTMLEAQKQASGAASSGGDRAWLREFASGGGNAPLRPYAIKSRYTLVQGKVIPAVLGRDLNTDLPGEITACTTIDVYDSLSSDFLLIPKGSCLSGQYSSSIRSGQERVMFAFSRIILPNGISVNLQGATGSDLGGAAGIEGDVNNHFLQMFGSSLMVALLADHFESDSSASSVNIGSASSAKTAAGQVLVDTSKSVLDRFRVIPPTIVVRKGARINVEVTRDMEFDGPYQAEER